jgi:hypothetical protein
MHETIIDGECAEGSHGSRAGKKGERDGRIGIEPDGWCTVQVCKARDLPVGIS